MVLWVMQAEGAEGGRPCEQLEIFEVEVRALGSKQFLKICAYGCSPRLFFIVVLRVCSVEIQGVPIASIDGCRGSSSPAFIRFFSLQIGDFSLCANR